MKYTAKYLHPATLLSEPFAMDCPVTTDGDYISSQVAVFPTDEDDNSQRVGGLASMPVTNGVRYHAPQSAMQDLHYPSSTALAMTPPDSCSDSFSPTSGPLFPHMAQHQHPFDRVPDFRRVPSLQPPTGMSATMQSPVHSVSSISALMGRNNAYSSSYALQHGMGLPLSGINDVCRNHGYSGTPRALDVLDRNQTALLQQPQLESPQRPHPQIEAPPFEETSVLESIVTDFGGTQQTVKPEVYAKIGRGFFPSDNKWTCYRRNYFAVTCSFSLHPWPSTVPLYIRHADQTLEPIRNFAMSISAIVNGQYGETRELVQHTPKRDKQSERPPPRVHLQPSPPQSLASATTGNGTHGFQLGSQSLDYNSSFAAAPQPPQSHMFERIQFQKATANNGKRRAQQQFYNLVVELQAEIAGPVGGESQWVLIARRHSHSMVVRGRSPGHYKDGRRDSTASMGPEGGSGDGSGSTLPHVMGQAARSHLLLYDSPHRGSLPYGRTDYRQMPTAEHSPISDSPLVSSSSSSGFDYSMINDTMDPMDTLKTETTLDPYQDPFTGVPNTRTTTSGFDPVYSTYNGYSTIPNSRSLCT
ncbi:p53-like transcription factor DNA-binding [Penicillium cataractarum]|uniref:P53-like transcription factor DNA-binding n=1 Tax=Penicillium cataractarum TaxID=2100454 RepID=A0A9W9S2P4_9EURO|nr:p53-like transcription factor DNA-binding [Penicillium cataractarum]KAJ5368488.1 p53-like transcription factor DNA-binding [Penicillium cataractarum]